MGGENRFHFSSELRAVQNEEKCRLHRFVPRRILVTVAPQFSTDTSSTWRRRSRRLRRTQGGRSWTVTRRWISRLPGSLRRSQSEPSSTYLEGWEIFIDLNEHTTCILREISSTVYYCNIHATSSHTLSVDNALECQIAKKEKSVQAVVGLYIWQSWNDCVNIQIHTLPTKKTWLAANQFVEIKRQPI